MVVLLSGLIGALFGALVTAGFHIWKLRRDELTARCDELCKVVSESSMLAADYWATDYSDVSKERIAEARIMGAQALCDGLYAGIRHRLVFAQASLDAAMSEFVDALSGGEFTVRGRAYDPSRVSRAPQASSALIVALRQAHHDTMPFSGLARIVNENRQRELDLPIGWKETLGDPKQRDRKGNKEDE